jgi:IS30 family transposase
VRRYKYIEFQDRKQLAVWYASGDRPADIAERMGVTTATIYRELKRGYTGNLDRNQRPEYNPVVAQQTTQAAFQRRGRAGAGAGGNGNAAVNL